MSVRNLRRRPGLVHHVMCAAGRVFTCDEQAHALCVNFVLQATNVQGLGMRLLQTNYKEMCAMLYWASMVRLS